MIVLFSSIVSYCLYPVNTSPSQFLHNCCFDFCFHHFFHWLWVAVCPQLLPPLPHIHPLHYFLNYIVPCRKFIIGPILWSEKIAGKICQQVEVKKVAHSPLSWPTYITKCSPTVPSSSPSSSSSFPRQKGLRQEDFTGFILPNGIGNWWFSFIQLGTYYTVLVLGK